MSAELYAVITTEQKLREQLEEGDFLDLVYEEKSIIVEDLPMRNHFGADFTWHYNKFASLLPAGTRAALNEFADVICWSSRDTPQLLESAFEPEGIDCSCSPTTCAHLATVLSSIDEAAVREVFIEEPGFTAEVFLDVLTAWRERLQRASSQGQFLFTFYF